MTPERGPVTPTEPPDPAHSLLPSPDLNVAAELHALATRLLALADRLEADPAAAQEPLGREAYRRRRLTQAVAAGLAEGRLVEAPAAPSPTRRGWG